MLNDTEGEVSTESYLIESTSKLNINENGNDNNSALRNRHLLNETFSYRNALLKAPQILSTLRTTLINDSECQLSEVGTMSEVGSQISQRSKSSQTESAPGGGCRSSSAGSGFQRGKSTKIYYHIDDEQTPYCTEVHVPPDKITLSDFKRVLNRSNFKYYCKALDQEVGGEVKAEIRDDNQLLCKSSNGQFELFLLTAEGSSHSDGTSTIFSKSGMRQMVPGPAPPSSFYPLKSRHLHHFIDSGHRHRLPTTSFEDSTIYTESDARIFSDDESRVSTSTDNITSVSRQHHNLYRRRNRRQHHRRQPSRASSMSSMTENSMQLNVVTVTLNMDTVNFLGISIVGQTSSRGDNGIYVANLMPGGAVALDGRIEPGDMLLQVNEISFENLTNDQAVDVLQKAISKRGPIKLTVAKSFDGSHSNYFMVASREPVRPIDTQAWVQHTNAIRGMTSAMNSIPEGSEETPTSMPGQYPLPPPMSIQTSNVNYNNGGSNIMTNFTASGRPSSSTATSNGSGGNTGNNAIMVQNGGIFMQIPSTNMTSGGIPSTSIATQMMHGGRPRLDVNSDKRLVVQTMLLPNSGLEIRNRTWLKMLIPMSFLGSDLIDWLLMNVDGLREKKEARKYASELLKNRLITHFTNKTNFTDQCYYVVGKEFSSSFSEQQHLPIHSIQPHYFVQQQNQLSSGGGMLIGNGSNSNGGQFIQNTGGGIWAPTGSNNHSSQQHVVAHSMVSEYASMPPMASPYPTANPFLSQNTGRIGPNGGILPDHHSQTNSNNSNEGGNSSGGGSSADQLNRRKAVIPPAPSLSMQPPSKPFSNIQQRYQFGFNPSISGAATYVGEEFFLQNL